MDTASEEDLRLAARVDVPVLVTADTPQKRDMYARLIHQAGDYRWGPFVTFSVGDTGAALPLYFETARGGTLFIDDVARLTAPGQSQLLALLLEERLRRASALPEEVTVRVRVVAGASRPLASDCANGAFCASLFYRLNVIHINLMP